MSKTKKVFLIAAGVIFLTLGSSASAGALVSWNGDDNTVDVDRNMIVTCDRESDSTPVKGVVQLQNGGTIEARDSDGSNNSCAIKGREALQNRRVAGHKTCEYRSFYPDACGNWVRY